MEWKGKECNRKGYLHYLSLKKSILSNYHSYIILKIYWKPAKYKYGYNEFHRSEQYQKQRFYYCPLVFFHVPFDYLYRNRQQMKLRYLRKLIYQVTTAVDINVPTKTFTLF